MKKILVGLQFSQVSQKIKEALSMARSVNTSALCGTAAGVTSSQAAEEKEEEEWKEDEEGEEFAAESYTAVAATSDDGDASTAAPEVPPE